MKNTNIHKAPPATAKVDDDVQLRHVELAVAAEVARNLAAGDEARLRIGGVELPVVVRQVESTIGHIGGPIKHRIACWIEFPDDSKNPDAPIIEGDLKEASVSFWDSESPVPQYEPNGESIADASVAGLLHNGGGRLYIGGIVFNAEQGEYLGGFEVDEDNQFGIVDFTFKIDGELKPIGFEKNQSDASLITLTIPIYPEFGRLYVDEPFSIDSTPAINEAANRIRTESIAAAAGDSQ